MIRITRQLFQSIRKLSTFSNINTSDNFRLAKATNLPNGCQQIIQSARRIATTLNNYADNRSLVKLKRMQADYQREDGRPIWLKAGFRDRLLYSVTILLTYIGLFNTLMTLYHNIKPNSWKTAQPC